MRTSVLLFALIALGLANKAASLTIPKDLSSNDRDTLTRTLGLTTGSKLLTNPYPLGGYSGLEVGVSLEFIDVDAINRLGCEPGATGCVNTERPSNRELTFPRLSLGKGLYHDLDAFIHFVPPVQDINVSDFGFQFRWSFYQAKFLPISLAASVHANQMNVDNKFGNQTYGGLITAGINVNDFSIYFGTGAVSARSQFTCGDLSNSTDALVDENSSICSGKGVVENSQNGTHSVVGLSFEFLDMFAAAQIDRYRDPVFSGKLGMRF